jgi:hypothetical protein
MLENSYKYTIIGYEEELSIVTVEINLPDGTVDESTFSVRSFCNSDDASKDEILIALDGIVASYVFNVFPPPAPKPEALKDLINLTREVKL